MTVQNQTIQKSRHILETAGLIAGRLRDSDGCNRCRPAGGTPALRPGRNFAARRGFTLIEIMVTVAIIVILMAVIIAVSSNVMRTNAEAQTKMTLKQLSGIAEAYERDTGTSLAALGDDKMAVFLTTVSAIPDYKKQLVALGTKVVVMDNARNITQINDGFQNAIHFRVPVPVSASGKSYYFESNGPDGLFLLTTGAPENNDNIQSNQN